VNQKPAVVPDQDMSPSPSQQTGRPRRPGYFLPRALVLLIRPTIMTTPWVTLISGCLVGTAILAAFAYVAHKYHSPLGQTTVRFTFLMPSATLAFVPATLFRPLTQTTPVPAWLASAIQSLLAFAVLALTCWAQLSLMAYTLPIHTVGAAIYPLIAVLTGWSTIFVAVAACCDRSRFADIGGATAVPISLAIIALAWFTPAVKDLFVVPLATLRAATIAWYIVAAAALAVAYAAMRDRWPRYTRVLARRKPHPGPRHKAPR
jgi:hypothetical protein